MTWVNDVIQGILLGGYYAIIAAGLALMFGVMRIINLAHGDIAVLGAYLVYLLLEHWNTSPFIALLPVLPVMVLFGYFLQRLVLQRSLRSGLLTPLLATFGLSIVIQNVLEQSFGPDVQSLGGQAGSLVTAAWRINSDISISALAALIFGAAIVIYAALALFLSRTATGRRMRAAAEDPDTAELVGIDSRAVYARATAIAVGIATLGGLALALRTTYSPYSGPDQLIFAFEAVVIGGLGSSLWGALLGGIVLGIAQTIGAQINPEWSILAGHIVFLVVLISPRGGLLTLRSGRGVGRRALARGSAS
ncbi:MAG: branched-chain amino acid ABC transporter permease [Solirubrobacteraceae bacterium]|jgi:branched-chain amino acid transport system permease protein